MRLLICAGGTGGGVYPAMAVKYALGNDAASVLWVGGQGGLEAGLVSRAGVPFTTIPAAGLHGVGIRALPRNLWALLKGTLKARRIVREFRPDVLLLTGGYVGAPMAVAARNIPMLLYVPDIEPGLAIKFLSRFATVIAATAEETRAFFSGRTRFEVTGYPTRPELTAWERSSARGKLGLNDALPVLLVFGGSKGAHSLNQAVLEDLGRLLDVCQLVHISGEFDWPDVEQARQALSPEIQERYHPVAYLHEDMGAALASADLVVSRAGASTLGEFPLFGLPAVLVPYPYAWRYQKVNADFLVQHGAAVILEDQNLRTGLFLSVTDLLASPERLEAMRAAMRSLARPDAAAHLASLLSDLTRSKSSAGETTW